MRVTAEKKDATRRRIVETALDLFRSRGFEATTTRDIARAAGIASGTLFNYFQTKESIVGQLADEALAGARSAFAKRAAEGDLSEELFALVAAELRGLKPLRKFIVPLLETALCPLAAGAHVPANEAFRGEHLEIVAEIARRHGIADLSPVALQVYWALYVGALTFWAADKSPKQEDTLALLDQSFTMFAAWICSSPSPLTGECPGEGAAKQIVSNETQVP
jgi:AcrR family transcriptional regulator